MYDTNASEYSTPTTRSYMHMGRRDITQYLSNIRYSTNKLDNAGTVLLKTWGDDSTPVCICFPNVKSQRLPSIRSILWCCLLETGCNSPASEAD